MAFNTEALGRRIGEIRRRRGLSQMALAEQIEKAPTFISSIETGQRGMSIETFVSIANALNVSADALLIDSIENTVPSLPPLLLTAMNLSGAFCWNC